MTVQSIHHLDIGLVQENIHYQAKKKKKKIINKFYKHLAEARNI